MIKKKFTSFIVIVLFLTGLSFPALIFSENNFIKSEREMPSSLEEAIEKQGLSREDFDFITAYYYQDPQPDELMRFLKIILT